MPSKKTRQTKKFKNIPKINHSFFWPLVILVFVLWVIYRSLFNFPIWFDESLGKLIFFAFPVWLYISISNYKKIINTLEPAKMHRGLLLGLAYGGIFGFAATIASYFKNKYQVQALDLFISSNFWWEFLLALLTAFWESLFFFSFVMLVIVDKFKKWSVLKQVLLTAGIFAVFHIANNLLRFDLLTAIQVSLLMFLFGLGQSLLFLKEKNAYALVLSHAIWGMVLLIHWQ